MKIAVVEDDDFDSQRLVSLLEQYQSEQGLEIALSRYADADSFLVDSLNTKFDIVFMDIELPGMNGLECAAKWRETDPSSPLIFVTNMAQYAIKGYEVNALDFVVKPIEYFPFKMKFEKALKYLNTDSSGQVVKAVTANKKTIMVKLSDIIYIESDGHFIALNDGKEEFRIHKSLREAEEEYSKFGFARVSGSFLVNLAKVKEVRRQEVVVGNVALPLSRNKKKEFMDAFTVYLSSHAA